MMNTFKEKKGFYGFSVDEVFYKEGKYFAYLIPANTSHFYNPGEQRVIEVHPSWLEMDYYKSITHTTNNLDLDQPKFDFYGILQQGGYYRIPKKAYKAFSIKPKISLVETGDTPINDSDFLRSILEDGIAESPFKVEKYQMESLVESTITDMLPKKVRTLENVFLYGFKVGQGDTLLLITSEGHSFLIDSNIYHNKSFSVSLYNFDRIIKEILSSHGLPSGKINFIIVTHKHLDHIRGLAPFIEAGSIKFDCLVINDDYVHETKPVKELIETAKKYIPTHFNMNSCPITLKDGRTEIDFFNPRTNVNNKKSLPDINDSSIAMCVRFDNNKMILTGDAGKNILNQNCYLWTNQRNLLLKVSHHGSSTGTDNRLITSVLPNDAFVSVGLNNKYRLPNKSVVDLLKEKKINVKYSYELTTQQPYMKYIL